MARAAPAVHASMPGILKEGVNVTPLPDAFPPDLFLLLPSHVTVSGQQTQLYLYLYCTPGF